MVNTEKLEAINNDVAIVQQIAAVTTILDVVCHITGMGFAAVARVTEDKWMACAVKDLIGFGLTPGGELEIKTTICDEIRQSGRAVIFDDATLDPVFCNHHTTKMYGLKSYISIPIIRRDGSFFGTLCAIDPEAAKPNRPEVISTFQLFAELIALQLDAIERLKSGERELEEKRQDEKLREEFIAVLGHDLRNPLGAITMGVDILQSKTADGTQQRLLTMMQKAAGRMDGLINDILDYGRGRLRGGIRITKTDAQDVELALHSIITESSAAFTGREIVKDINIGIAQKINCDIPRLNQLVTNLLTNALTHGDAEQPVTVRANVANGEFNLSVINHGQPIPEAVQSQIFKPFTKQGKNGSGLGLGLYICDEIAKAHDGAMTLVSTEKETVFTLSMPV